MKIETSKITQKQVKIHLNWNKMNCSKCLCWSLSSKACDHFGNCVNEMNFCKYFIPNGYRQSKETIIKMFESISQRFIRENQE